MPLRPTHRGGLRARPRGALLHAKAVETAIFHISYLPRHVHVPDVRAYATATEDAAATPQPVVDSGSEPGDEAAVAEYIMSIQQCRTEEELERLVKGKDFRSPQGSMVLGNVVRQLRQIAQQEGVPWGKQSSSPRFGRQLCHETKVAMPHMLPRTIANTLHYLHSLACLDKLLLAKASEVVSQRVKEDPTAFKITEIAQIGNACMRIKFQNRRLSAALAENILTLPESQLNPRAVLNILCASARMGLSNQQVACRLMNFLADNMGMIEVHDLGRVATPTSRYIPTCRKQATNLLKALQYAVCRQKPKAIKAMTAGILLRDLSTPGLLEPEAAQVLISIVQNEDRIGQSLGAVLQEAAPGLEKMGYQVNVESSFSDLGSKGSDTSGSTVVDA